MNFGFDNRISRVNSVFLSYLIVSNKIAGIIEHLNSVVVTIDGASQFEQYSSLSTKLMREMEPLFEAAKYPESERSDFVARLISAVLQPQLETRIIADDEQLPHSAQADLPTQAPELWSVDRQRVTDAETGRERRENAAEFTRRVYGPWLGHGLTRSMVRKMDNPLFQALHRTFGSNLPADIPLPTKKEENDRWTERVSREGLAAVLPKEGSVTDILREAHRLQSAAYRRRKS